MEIGQCMYIIHTDNILLYWIKGGDGLVAPCGR